MLAAGQRAPAFMLRDATGILRGRVDALEKGPLLLMFYKVNCPTCQLAMPKLQQVHEAYGDQVVVWGISQNDEAETTAFAQEKGATFPQLIDDAEEDYHVSRQYEISHVPSVFLVEHPGVILRTLQGWDRDAWNELSATLAELTGQEAVVLSTPEDGLPVFKPG